MKSNNREAGQQILNRSWYKRALSTIINIKIGWLLTILLIIAGIAYTLSFWLGQAQDSPVSLFASGLFRLIADACLSAVVVGFGYEWLVRRETTEALSLLFRDELGDQEKEFVDTVLQEIPRTLLLNREVQKTLLIRPDRIDEIIKGALFAKLGDEEISGSIYDGLLQKTFSYTERYANLRHEIALTTVGNDEPEDIRNTFFDVIVNLRYETKLESTRFIFCRAKDHDQFNLRVRDPLYIFTWRLRETNSLPIDSPKGLDLLKFTIDEIELNKQFNMSSDGAYEIVCEHSDLATKIGKEVTIYYSVKTKLARLGHIFFSNAIRPTKGTTISFNYARTDIEEVKVYDFFVSAKKPLIYSVPPTNPHTIVVELNEWIFPKGGAAFVWRLKGEDRLKPSSREEDLRNKFGIL